MMSIYSICQDKLMPYGDATPYIHFCVNHSIKYSKGLTQRHHILPKCLFPEYKNFNENRWNIVNLTNEDHYIAHYLLAKITKHPSLINAWYAMSNKNFLNADEPIKLIGPEQYSDLIKIRNKMVSERNRNKVVAKDIITGKIIRVTKEEFDSNPNLVGATKGRGGEHFVGKHMTTMINLETGKPEKVNPKIIDRTKYVGITKGSCIFKDKDNNRIFTKVDDPRVISGEFTGLNAGVHNKRKPFERKPKKKYIITDLKSGDAVEILKTKNYLAYIKNNHIDFRKNKSFKLDVYKFTGGEWRHIQ